jgi:hypothetical protein
MGKGNKGKNKHKIKRLKEVKRAVGLAMDCTWSEEGRTLKNKDEPVYGVGKIKNRISEM